MGAWIEITSELSSTHSIETVAPYMGAWIEIDISKFENRPIKDVAPYMGAWIEIAYGNKVKDAENLSHPTWVRGLK